MDPIRIVALLPTWKTFVDDVLAAAVQWKCTQCAQNLETIGDDEMNLLVWAGPTYSLIACNLDVAVAN